MNQSTENNAPDPQKDQNHAPHETFRAGETIIVQGDAGACAYYIETGRVEVLVNEEGHELKVAELGPGDIFGEMALINHEPRSASVRALEDTVLDVVSRDEIEGKIGGIRDKATRKLIDVLAGRLRDSTQAQMRYYKDLTEFQDRVTGMVDRVHIGVGDKKRARFREEIEPLLNQLQNVMDKYQKE